SAKPLTPAKVGMRFANDLLMGGELLAKETGMPKPTRKSIKRATRSGKPTTAKGARTRSTRCDIATLAHAGKAQDRARARAGTGRRKAKGRGREETRDSASSACPDAVYLDR